MRIRLTIYDHIALVSTGFCLKLCCCFSGKVVVRFVAVSPGSVVIAKGIANLSMDGIPVIYIPGQATVIMPETRSSQ